MKLFVTTVAFAALLASPALAQNYGPYQGYGPAYQAYGYQVGPYQSYGYAGPAFNAFGLPGRSFDWRNDVYNTRGRYVGSDPDPRIRNDLARDPPNTE